MAVVPKVVQVLYSGYNKYRKPAQQAINKAKQTAEQKAKEINSIFTAGTNGLKAGIVAAGTALGLGNQANASQSGVSSNWTPTGEATLRPASPYDLFRGNIQAFFRNLGDSSELGAKARQDALMETIATFLPIKVAGASAVKAITTKASQIFKSQGAKAAENYVINSVMNLRNKAVKAAAKIADSPVAKKFEQGQQILKGSIDNAINNAGRVKNSASASADEKYMAQLLQKNAGNVKRIADEIGVKDAKEIPSILKFINQTGDIIKNAPVNVARKARGLPIVGIGATGLSIYDLYQEFKKGGDNLLPSIGSNVLGAAGGFLPGGTIVKLLYSALGYKLGDSLTRAAMQKLGVTPQYTEQQQQEFESGMAYPGLQAELGDEYFTGQSGRKYHIVGDKAYAFDTGKPVNVNQMLDDVTAKYNFDRQRAENEIANIEQQKNDFIAAANQGYNVDPQFYNQLNAQQQEAINYLNSLPAAPQINEYDASGDLVEQYKQKNNITTANQVQQMPQVQQIDYNQIYQQAYERIADNTFRTLDQYISPKGLAVDYYNHQLQAQRNLAPRMTIDEYVGWRKLQAMQAAAPQIQEAAMKVVDNYRAAQDAQAQRQLDWYKAGETERHNRATEMKDIYTLGETMRSNRANEQRQMFEAGTGRLNAITSQQNAATSRMTEQRQQQMIPYQQAVQTTQAAANMGFSGMSPDQILNSNPQVFGQVFPGTVGQGNQQQPSTQVPRGQQTQMSQRMFNEGLYNQIQQFKQINIPQYRINQ